MQTESPVSPVIGTRRQCVKTIDLRFFEDNANGEWGLAHKETLNGIDGNDGFNAFWSGLGLFHDVFEHNHEFTDPYFRDKFAMNVGGEVSAMGACWYYYDTLNFQRRIKSLFYSPSEGLIRSTCDLMIGAIRYNDQRFGLTLESNVPSQSPLDNELEDIIDKHFEEIVLTQPNELGNIYGENQIPEKYKKSVTKEKLANLYRYGYRMAEKLVPYNKGYCATNMQCLSTFWTFWNDFCDEYEAEKLAKFYEGITFRIYHQLNSRGEIIVSWKAIFEPISGINLRPAPNKVIVDSSNLPIAFPFPLEVF